MDEELLAKVKKWAIIGSFFALAFVFFALGWHTALKIYVVVIGVFAVLAILIQSGKGGGLAASLGGLGGESLLGVHSASPIAKATYVMLALFLFICMLTAIMGVPQQRGQGLLEMQGQAAPIRLPATLPEAAPPAQPEQPAEGAAPAGEPTATESTPPGGPAQND